MAEVEAEKNCEEETVKGGELLFCGATAWDTVGRKKIGIEGNLYSPTRLRPLVGINIRFVASGCGKFFLVVSPLEFASAIEVNVFCMCCSNLKE